MKRRKSVYLVVSLILVASLVIAYRICRHNKHDGHFVTIVIPDSNSSSEHFRAGPGYEYRKTGHYGEQGEALAVNPERDWVLIGLEFDPSGGRHHQSYFQSWVPKKYIRGDLDNLLVTNTTILKDPYLSFQCAVVEDDSGIASLNISLNYGENQKPKFSLEPMHTQTSPGWGMYKFDPNQVATEKLVLKLNGQFYHEFTFDGKDGGSFLDSCVH